MIGDCCKQNFHLFFLHTPHVAHTCANCNMCIKVNSGLLIIHRCVVIFRFQRLASRTGSQTSKLQIVSLRTPHHVDRLMSCYGGNTYINCVYEFIQMICGKFRRERPHNPTVTPPQNHHKMAAVPGSCHRAQSALLYCSRDAPGGSSITAGIRALNKHVKARSD